MWISRYICIFMFYSFIGWIYETLFCTVKGGKWENRGFLYGPVCPIYGIGAVLISIIAGAAKQRGIALEPWQIFAVSVLGSAVLEYVTAWALEKLFHAQWWDYSRLPLNLHGRISLFTSLGFGAAGLLIVYCIAPFTERMMSHITPLAMEFLALLFTVIFTADLTLTVTALQHFDRTVMRVNDTLNRNMEDLVDRTVKRAANIKDNIKEEINERLSTPDWFARSAIRRVKDFKHKDSRLRETADTIRAILRKK